MYHTHVQEAPFAISGSCFLVGGGGAIYVVTAKHVVRGCPTDDILVYPSDKSKTPLVLSETITFHDDPDDPDATDVVLIRAEIKHVPKNDRQRSRVIDLNEIRNTEWFADRFASPSWRRLNVHMEPDPYEHTRACGIINTRIHSMPHGFRFKLSTHQKRSYVRASHSNRHRFQT